MELESRQQIFEKIFKENLKIETYSKSINSLFSRRLLNKIDYKPYYQRNYVWDYNKATYFIESILLGTEIPPLIFFNNNSGIEIIDGRQRFETILRFMKSEFPLKSKGLNILKQLKNTTYDELAKEDKEIIDNFLDAKLRIIEFQLVNNPPLDKFLEDRVKKEIFSRYNSGITPLKKAEIDNAIFDKDQLSGLFKTYLGENIEVSRKIYSTFFLAKESSIENPPIETLMTFIRIHLILPMIPIRYFANSVRTDLLQKFYEKFADDSVDEEEKVIEEFIYKINYIAEIRGIAQSNSFHLNRLALECFLWALGILELEEIDYRNDNDFQFAIAQYISDNLINYTEENYNFGKEVFTRYNATANFISERFGIDTSIYIFTSDSKRLELNELKKPHDTSAKLSELEHLRLNKPEPVRNSIDDILNMMTRRRFLVRPSYQRREAINPTKASSIVESVILGITLPALFIYKREDGISEVIDGQQRILTLLGFLGAEYIDEKEKPNVSKNHNFSLRKLRILKDLDGKKFSQLDESLQEKIYDFQLYIVEIDQKQNPEFNPIDLFIRLNDKPFPIREHSFEMWNSWVDIELIQHLKELTNYAKSWFFIKHLQRVTDRDRMENEELITALSFLEYSKAIDGNKKVLDIYQRTERLNARLSNKASISSLFQEITEDQSTKKSEFLAGIKSVKSFIRSVKYVLLDKNMASEELSNYLKSELDEIFKAGKNPKYFRRTMQDFYILWYLLEGINFEMIKHNRLRIKEQLAEVFRYIKNIPETHWENGLGQQHFFKLAESIKNEYKQEQRKIRLSESQKLEMIKNQNNLSGITGAPIFLGDEIEADHTISIAKGGEDSLDNLKIAHKDENRSKGSKSSPN